MESRHFLRLRSHLALALLHLATQHGTRSERGTKISVRLSQQELGDFIGASRASVNRQLMEWRQQGVLEADAGRLVICSLERLSAIATAGELP